MKDQVDGLRVDGVAASYLNSTLLPHERDEVIASVRDDRCRLLYVSPERLVGDGSQGLRRMLQQSGVRSSPSTRRTASASGGTISGRSTASSGGCARSFPGRLVPRLHGDGDRARAARHRRRAAAARSAGAGRIVRPAEPHLPRASARQPAPAADRHPRAARRRGGHRLLLVAARGRGARRMAGRRGAPRGAVSRRPARRGAQPEPGAVPRRAGRHRRRDRGVRHGDRSVERALRRARRRAAIARALPAGVGPRRPRRPAGRMRPRSIRAATSCAGGRCSSPTASGPTARGRCCATWSATPRARAAGTGRWSSTSASRTSGRVRRVRLVPEGARSGRRLGDARAERFCRAWRA